MLCKLHSCKAMQLQSVKEHASQTSLSCERYNSFCMPAINSEAVYLDWHVAGAPAT